VRRKLYSDSDYAVFAFRRYIIFDAIDVGALAPDLADRTVPITLKLIPDEGRLDEETFWSEWTAAHPQLLGGLLDLAARVMARRTMRGARSPATVRVSPQQRTRSSDRRLSGLTGSLIDVSWLADDFFGGTTVPPIPLNIVGAYTNSAGNLFAVGVNKEGVLCEAKRANATTGTWGSPYPIAGEVGA
jgi:hypothetical protein